MNPRESETQFWRPILILSTVGIILVSCVIAGYLLGRLLDGWLDTEPWLMVICTLFGSVAGFVQMFTIVKRYMK